MPSLGIALHPEGCTGPFTMPAQGATSASGAMPTDGSLRRLEIGVQAVKLSPYHTGPADASVQHDRSGVLRCSTGMPLISAKLRTALLKRSPICLNKAGEATGLPRC